MGNETSRDDDEACDPTTQHDRRLALLHSQISAEHMSLQRRFPHLAPSLDMIVSRLKFRGTARTRLSLGSTATYTSVFDNTVAPLSAPHDISTLLSQPHNADLCRVVVALHDDAEAWPALRTLLALLQELRQAGED